MNENLLAIIQKIKNESGYNPGKKQLQKLIYLIQAKGIDLNYEYGIHFYGPYAEALSQDLLSLYVIGQVDFHVKGQTHEVIPSDRPAEMSLSSDDSTLVDKIIRQYKDYSPYKLELITTAHFIAANLGSSDEEILAGMKKVKKDKYSESEIREAISHLRAEYAM